MASLYKRPKSPYWWIKYRDPETGTLIRESTGCLIGQGRSKAVEICARVSLKEAQRPIRSRNEEHWDQWVVPFLTSRHASRPGTLKRTLSIWTTLRRYLAAERIETPRHLTRSHCLAYVQWRANPDNLTRTGAPVHINTILTELVQLSKIMNEAVTRQYTHANPASKLAIKQAPPREKGEMTDWHIQVIRDEINRMRTPSNPDRCNLRSFFHISFEIAIHQGCRLAETCLPMNHIDCEAMQITFLAKGSRVYRTELNPNLLPILQPLLDSGASHTYTSPTNKSLRWWEFFNRLRKRHPGKFDNISFHSTRVTCISRLERAGAPEKVVMDLVNHSSTTVHRVYRRATRQELQRYWHAASPTHAGDPASPQDETRGASGSNPSPYPKKSSSRSRTANQPASPSGSTIH
jgi:integrase